jgi:hypothetical protein
MLYCIASIGDVLDDAILHISIDPAIRTDGCMQVFIVKIM